MTKGQLKTRMIELRAIGLSETIAAKIENAITYRKWGTLGGWPKAKKEIESLTNRYSPALIKEVRDILNS